MNIFKRFSFFLSGFSLGMIILVFFLKEKNTSCDYGPNARVTKSLSISKKRINNENQLKLKKHNIDSTTLFYLIKTADVDFSRSITKTSPCKEYILNNTLDSKPVELKIELCDSISEIKEIKI